MGITYEILEISLLGLAVGLMIPATLGMWRWAFFGKRVRR